MEKIGHSMILVFLAVCMLGVLILVFRRLFSWFYRINHEDIHLHARIGSFNRTVAFLVVIVATWLLFKMNFS